jgi:hypothetical protein
MMQIAKRMGMQVLGLAFASSAFGITLATPPLDASQWDEYACNIINLGTQNLTAKVQLVDFDDGTVLASGELAAPPGAGARLTQLDEEFGFGAYCRFDVPGARRDFRASLTVYSGTEGRDVANAEAR